MKPGRELDALVAEKVFGAPAPRDENAFTEAGYWAAEDKQFIHVAHYSSDIAAAWEVFEKLRDDRDDYNIFQNYHSAAEDSVWDGFNHYHVSPGMCDDFGCGELCATAHTAPHAICLAALKAKGIEA